MRLVCFGDIHMALRAVDHLAPVLREADCAILTGDLTHFGDPPDAFRVVDAVRQYCPSLLAVTGNLDLLDLWRRLGVAMQGNTVICDDAAPLASIRRAITALERSPQGPDARESYMRRAGG